MSAAPALEPLADDALLLRLGSAIDPSTSAAVVQLAARIRAAQHPWLRDLVPAYASLAVFFDPEAFAGDGHTAVGEVLMEAATRPLDAAQDAAAPRLREIPVHYGGQCGVDLEGCAQELGLTVEEVVTRHGAAEYTVAMIGFAPGFPYLLGLDPSLALPRLATPRAQVPAGSVAIGGAQTGIYPRDSAGGWRLIGRTPLVLFDASRDPPSLLQAGDRVKFVAVSGQWDATP